MPTKLACQVRWPRKCATIVGMTDHEKALAEAAEKYRQARPELQAAIRAAHQAGMRQVDILRATGYVWSREHVRLICSDKDGERPEG